MSACPLSVTLHVTVPHRVLKSAGCCMTLLTYRHSLVWCFSSQAESSPSPTHTTTCSVGSAGLHKNQLTTNQVGTTSPRAGTGQSSVRAYDAQAMTVLSTCIPRFGRASFYVKCLNWHCCLCACCCNLSRCPVLLCPSAMTKAWLRRLAIRGYEETRCGRSSRKSRSREAGTRKKEATSRPW